VVARTLLVVSYGGLSSCYDADNMFWVVAAYFFFLNACIHEPHAGLSEIEVGKTTAGACDAIVQIPYVFQMCTITNLLLNTLDR